MYRIKYHKEQKQKKKRLRESQTAKSGPNEKHVNFRLHNFRPLGLADATVCPWISEDEAGSGRRRRELNGEQVLNFVAEKNLTENQFFFWTHHLDSYYIQLGQSD